jgi:hypothetical protein
LNPRPPGPQPGALPIELHPPSSDFRFWTCPVESSTGGPPKAAFHRVKFWILECRLLANMFCDFKWKNPGIDANRLLI